MRPLKGFSLTEIIIAIAIVVILSTIFALNFFNITQKARDTQRKADIDAIFKSYEAGYNSLSGLYQILKGSDFFSGHIPYPPEGGQYSGLLTAPASSYQVCAALTNHPTIICNTPSETCFCRSSAQNVYIAGAAPVPTSAPSPSFSTDTTVPAAAAIYILAKNSNSVTVKWIAPGDDGNSGQANAYNLRRSFSNIPDFDWDVVNWPETSITTSFPAPAGTTETYTVSGLSSNIRYYFAVKSADEAGNESPLSNNAYVTTDPTEGDIKPPDVISLIYASMTSTSIVFNISAPYEDGFVSFSSYDLSQRATSYDLRRGPAAINAGNWNTQIQVTGLPAPAIPGTVQTINVTGLTPNTYYCFAIRAIDEVGNQSGISASVCKRLPTL